MPSARHDAEVLAAHSLGVERRDLWRHDDVGAELRGVRRPAGRPRAAAAHHRRGVRSATSTCRSGPGVFVPRPETEVVGRRRAGSGCAGVDRPRRRRPVHRVRRDRAGGGRRGCRAARCTPSSWTRRAHAWAARNCAGSTVDLRLGDMATAFPELDGTVDVVVSNPPYIPVGAVIRDPEVADPRPGASRCGPGDDGLDAMRVVEQVAARLLRPGGRVVAEHADLQGAARARRSSPAAGRWPDVADHQDLAGRDRYVTAVRIGATMAAAREGWPADGLGAAVRHGDARASGRSGSTWPATPSAAASWSCCRPTRSTGWAPTRSRRTPSARCWPPRAAAGDMPVPGPGRLAAHPRRHRDRPVRARRATWSRRSGRAG